jgi:hypothetical protein
MRFKKTLILIYSITIYFFSQAQVYDKVDVENMIYVADLKPAEAQSCSGKGIFFFKPLLDSDYIDFTHPDKLHAGVWIDYFKEDTNRIACRIVYKDSLPNGLSEYYYFNGNVKGITNFKNGHFDGYQAKFYLNGILMSQTNYLDDKEIGPGITYYENGHMQREDFYENGTIYLQKEWDINGKLIKVTKPEDGVHFSFYRNGKKAIENKIKNGRVHLHKEWDENGKLIKKEKY